MLARESCDALPYPIYTHYMFFLYREGWADTTSDVSRRSCYYRMYSILHCIKIA